jgi:hypothetical protein
MDGQEGVGLGQNSVQRREMIPIGGAHVSVEEREGEGTLSGLSVAGPRASSGAGPIWFPPACFLFLYFLFLLFYFLISDLIQTFANLFQINSNKFLNFSNVQQGILKQ